MKIITWKPWERNVKIITRHTADRMSATKRIGKERAMVKIYCDRCGEEITGIPLKMLPTACKGLPADVIDEMLQLKEPLRHKVFCKECIAEIADFALNKNTCDECVQQMMDENAMLREVAEETEPRPKIEPDPDEIDWNAALNRMEQCRFSAKVLIPAEKIQEIERIIREECQYESGQYIIPLQPVDPDLISKYRKAIEKYGVPKQCINVPVTSSGNQSEGT